MLPLLIGSALAASPVLGNEVASGQSFAPSPSIGSVTISGNQVTVTFTVPTQGAVERLDDVYDSQSSAVDPATGKFVNVYTACWGDSSCSFTNLPAGVNYFEVATDVESSTSGLGCVPPAAGASRFPNGMGIYYSRVSSLVVPSTGTSNSSTTTTSSPVTSTTLGTSITNTGSLGALRGFVYLLGPLGGRAAATDGSTLKIGDTLVTGPDSKVEVTLADGSVLQIGANSTFQIPEFQYNRRADEKELWISEVNGVVRLFTGKGLVCKSLSSSSCWVDIETHRNNAGITAALAVRGTDVVVRSNSKTNALQTDLHSGIGRIITFRRTSSKDLTSVNIAPRTRAVIDKKGKVSTSRLSAAQWASDTRAA